MNNEFEVYPVFKHLRYWAQSYGRQGATDQRGAQEFLEIEPDHVVKAFKAELHAITKGRYSTEVLDELVRTVRKAKHGSYEHWAELMLEWMAGTRR